MKQERFLSVTKKACQIARISEELAMGKKGEEVFPYIPFYQVLREKKAVPEKVIRLFGNQFVCPGSVAGGAKRGLYRRLLPCYRSLMSRSPARMPCEDS